MSANSYPPEMVNNLFLSHSGTEEGRTKIAQMAGAFIRDRLRELSFARNILPPEPVGRNDCQISVNHDQLTKIVWMEPRSKAMPISFRGQPKARLIRAPKFEISFFTIASEKFEKYEQELMAYDFPVTKMVEENSTKDIQEIEDREFLTHIEACIQARQYEANANTWVAFSAANVDGGNVVSESVIKGELAVTNQATSDDWTVHALQKVDITRLVKLLDRKRLRSKRILMTEPDYDDITQWTIEDVGSDGAWEMTREGYKPDKLIGREIIRTIKVDILREGNLYCFAEPEFLGKFYILNQLKFYIDKIGNLITWWSWEDIGMGIGNIAAVCKLELYCGSVTNTVEDSGYEVKMPSTDDNLGAVNNRADQGLTFPQISSY